MVSDFQLGTTEVGMADITPLVVLNGLRYFYPLPTYEEYAVEVEAADALVYGHGWELAQWRWGLFPLANRNTIRSTYCTGKSATVFVQTLVYGAYIGYEAVMIWPKGELIRNNFVIDFTINFRLVEAL